VREALRRVKRHANRLGWCGKTDHAVFFREIVNEAIGQ
jgi:hypothetical protein